MTPVEMDQAKYDMKDQMSPPIPIQLQPYPFQVSGCSIVMLYNKGTICKPLMAREYEFYLRIPEILKQFTPRYQGVTEVTIEKSDDGVPLCYALSDNIYPSKEALASKSEEAKRAMQMLYEFIKQDKKLRLCNGCKETTSIDPNDQSCDAYRSVKLPNNILNPWTKDVSTRVWRKLPNASHNTHTFIVLENITAQYKRPCILDLKMGLRQHHDAAPQEKVDLSRFRIASTTSRTIGTRLGGMQIYDVKENSYKFINKYKGRAMSLEELTNTLRDFFSYSYKFRIDILQECISRIKSLIDCIQKAKEYRFYSSSMLFIYDACSQEVVVDVRMIDFANVTPASSDLDSGDHDEGIIFGLRNLICLFKRFYEEFLEDKKMEAL